MGPSACQLKTWADKAHLALLLLARLLRRARWRPTALRRAHRRELLLLSNVELLLLELEMRVGPLPHHRDTSRAAHALRKAGDARDWEPGHARYTGEPTAHLRMRILRRHRVRV